MNRREALFSAMGAAAALPATAAFAAAPRRNASVADARRLQDSTLLLDQLDGSALTEEYLTMLEQAGVDTWQGGMPGISGIGEMLSFFDTYSSRIVQVKSVRDIRQAHKDKRVGFLFGWQAANVLLMDPTAQGEGLIAGLRTYKELGLRICGLVYNIESPIGGGSLVPHLPLTPLGRKLVEEIHKQRIVLDVGGHTGDQTSLDALEMSSGVPIICTHTNLRSIMDNPRNMPDKLIEKVAATGGVIGLTAVNDFHARSRKDEKILITPQVGLDKHLDQYDYLKKLVGVDHIGLGSDFMYGRKDIMQLNPTLWPPSAYSVLPPAKMYMVKGFEKITELPNVVQGLMQRGWTDEDLRKVLGGNWLRVYEKVWGS
jgi:membrane dipeptidase